MGDAATAMPDALASLLSERRLGSAKIVLRSDLAFSRGLSGSWVALTQSHVVAWDPSAEARVFALAGVKEVKIDERYGNARLVVCREDAEEVLIDYSEAMVPEFATFSRVVNEAVKGRDIPMPAEQPGYCVRCGLPLPERGAHCPQCVPSLRIMARLLGMLKQYRGRLAILTALTFTTVIARMGPPLVTKHIVDDVIKDSKLDSLLPWILAMLGLLVVQFTSELLSGRQSAWLAGRLVADLRSKLQSHIQELQLRYFNKRDSGELVGRVMHDTQSLQHFLIDGLPYMLVNSITFVGIAVMLVRLDVVLSALVFLPVPFLILGGRWFFFRMQPLERRYGTTIGRLHTDLSESIGGIKVIKAANRQNDRAQQFADHSERLFGTIFSMESLFIVFTRGMFWLMSLGVTACWYAGAHRIVGGTELTVGGLVAFIGYIWLFYGPLQWSSAILNWMTHAMASAERVFGVLDEPAEAVDSTVTMPRVGGRIEFKDVHFSYERGKEVIRGISFAIEAGEMVGLVGKSGAGKSTLINLICRFWDPDSGTVFVDGVDLRTVKLESYRKQIGVVMQEPFLFRASITENIRFAVPNATFRDVIEAARAARAHEFILSKTDGYDTIVGEGGAGLSTGEKQRISIARAVLQDPPILILDEATSSVDVETEKQIQEAITALVRNRTTIAIAHRLSTLRNATRLIVVEDGAIVESGTHDELVAAGGVYAKLVETQAEVNRMRVERAV